MPVYEKVRAFTDSLSAADGANWPQSLAQAIKDSRSIELIDDVTEKSGKKIEESVLAVVSAVRFLEKTDTVTADNFIRALDVYPEAIRQLAIDNKVQTNQPERFLPILECLKLVKNQDRDLGFIELGCSMGLIGLCLLNQEKILSETRRYFLPNQQLPDYRRNIISYLGLEPNRPDLEWTLSCYSRPDDRTRISCLIDDYSHASPLPILPVTAQGFSALEDVLKIPDSGLIPVVLTSFMLYQLEPQTKKNLTEEILAFVKSTGGHWINLEIHTDDLNGSMRIRFFLSFDDIPVIELADDRGLQWSWIKEVLYEKN